MLLSTKMGQVQKEKNHVLWAWFFGLCLVFLQGLKPRLFALHTGMHIDQHGFAIGI